VELWCRDAAEVLKAQVEGGRAGVDFILHPGVDSIVREDGVRERLFSHTMNADLVVEAFSGVKDKVCSSPDPKVVWNAGRGPSQSTVGGVALYSDKS
jgi:hypothetical protein